MHHQTDRIPHTIAIHGMRNSLVGPPRGIDLTMHHTKSRLFPPKSINAEQPKELNNGQTLFSHFYKYVVHFLDLFLNSCFK